MGLFDKKKKVVEVEGQKIELQPKPSLFSGLGKKPSPKPAQQPATQATQAIQQTVMQSPQQVPSQSAQAPPAAAQAVAAQTVATQAASAAPQQQQTSSKPAQEVQQSQPQISSGLEELRQKLQSTGMAAPEKKAQQSAQQKKKPSSLRMRLEGIGAKKKGLELALKTQGVKVSLYEFVRNMLIAAAALGGVLGIAMFVLFQALGLALAQSIVFAALIGFVAFFMGFQTFLNFPTHKSKGSTKNIERDILFAARDMIISLRSGMPLFNAITSISTGYGDASREFSKIVERVQLGMSLEDAIDQTVSESKSPSFRRIMLQAAVSIRAGADVVSALQEIIDQLSQERIIELRRYGQRLNAIAMFYMLFGIILPSMGIAVVTILTTFIAIFTINTTILEFALVGIIFLQIVFLKMITGSRPVFTL